MSEFMRDLGREFAPDHCHRHLAGDTIFFWPWLPLVLQSALLFHTPSKGPRWLLANSAWRLRLLLTSSFAPLYLHIALGYRNYNVRILGYEGNSANFVIAVFALSLAYKSIELGVLRERPRLAHSDQSEAAQAIARQAGGSESPQRSQASVDIARPPQPFYFPHTPVPLFLEHVFSLRGVGWEWGVPSKAAYGLPKDKAPPTSRSGPRTVAFLKSRLATVALCAVMADITDNIATHPSYLASFDAYPHAIIPANPLAACTSKLRRLTAEGIFAVTVGAAVYAPIQGVYAFLSILSTLISPKTQTSWDPLPFDWPIKADSLRSLWSDRWHALFRRTWYICGYLPASKISLKVGLSKSVSRNVAVFATFLVSGLTHEIGLHSMRRSSVVDAVSGRIIDRTNEEWTPGQCYPVDETASGFGFDRFVSTRFFLMQAVLLFAEQTFKRVTGRKVSGWPGRIWVVLSLALTLRGMLRAWLMHGFVDGIRTSPLARPVAQWFVHGVLRFVAGVEPLSAGSS